MIRKESRKSKLLLYVFAGEVVGGGENDGKEGFVRGNEEGDVVPMVFLGHFAPVSDGVGIGIRGYVTITEHVALTQGIEVAFEPVAFPPPSMEFIPAKQ